MIVVQASGWASQRDRVDGELDVAATLHLPFTAAHLGAELRDHRPSLVLCTHSLDELEQAHLAVYRAWGAEVCLLAAPAHGTLGSLHLRRLAGLPWLRIVPRRGWRGRERAKRCLDLAVIAVSAPLWMPLMVLITLAVIAFTGTPLYVQTRVGAGGRPFRMVKFRTMIVNAELATGPVMWMANDRRVTRIGKILRRVRLDELPQLWNVLRGEMSLVGPRPERPEFAAELRRLPDYELRELMRPGLTGIAQLTGGYDATAEEKLRCDLLYLHSRSLRGDLALIALTVLELLRGFPRG